MDLVSVLVTTKNEEKNLARCLESVMKQTYPKIEIIVVDNFSDDDTVAIARKFTEHVYEKGPERSAQRNFGAMKCKGKYILYLDADMILAKDVVSVCEKMCRRKGSISGIYVPETIIGEGFWIKVRKFEREFYDGTVIDAVRFVPRKVWHLIGGFDPMLFGAEDWDFDKKIRSAGKVAIARSTIYHNEGKFNLSGYLKKKEYYSNCFDQYKQKWGESDPDIKKQFGFFYRFLGVYLEKGKFIRLIGHPILTIGMYYLRFRVGLSYLKMQKLEQSSGG